MVERDDEQNSWVLRVGGADGHLAAYRLEDGGTRIWIDLLTTLYEPDPVTKVRPPSKLAMAAGWGRWKFAKLVELWWTAGVETCGVWKAEGNCRTPDWTGYYVWPRFGFDATMSRTQHARLPVRYKGSRDVQKLLAKPGGPDVWRRFGGRLFDLTFDLTPDSRNRRLFDGR